MRVVANPGIFPIVARAVLAEAHLHGFDSAAGNGISMQEEGKRLIGIYPFGFDIMASMVTSRLLFLIRS